MGLKVAVIVDDQSVPAFLADALNRLEQCDQLLVVSCINTHARKRIWKHLLYYLLNLVTIRNPQTRSIPLSRWGKPVSEVIEFQAEYDGAWQRLPRHVLDLLAAASPDVILKFGMGLLRVPERSALPAPILSFHHGDPRGYRGRPAGFYELLHGECVMGQIVQVLSNRLDSGSVVAFAETKVRRHSYRATLMAAYRASPLLINRAVHNALAGRTLPIEPTGRNYRLPSNLVVLKFLWIMFRALASLLIYGALREKDWNVASASHDGADVDGLASSFPPPERWDEVPRGSAYSFYADPFFNPNPEGILVEAFNRRRGKGEILLCTSEEQRTVYAGAGHVSYPAVFEHKGASFVLPELAEWSRPHLFRFEQGQLHDAGPLDIEGAPCVIDPTLFEQDGTYYLFGNTMEHGPDILSLWSARSLDGRYQLHPASPLMLSPRGARMGGGLVRNEHGLYRFGQSNVGRYGDGLFLFRIECLSADAYLETCVGEIRLADRRGPHTLNVRHGRIVFDWYRESFAVGAGWRRLRQRYF